MIQKNDIAKRHDGAVQNDIYRQSPTLLDIFTNQGEKALFSYTLKIEKIVAALYLITDVMDAGLPLTGALRGESLDLLNACYRLLTQTGVPTPSEVSKVVVRIEHVMSLVSIGRIAYHISDMNAQIIISELAKVLELIHGEIKIITRRYASYSHHAGDAQPVISHKILDDVLFDQVAHERRIVYATHQGRRAQVPESPRVPKGDVQDLSDIKTTPERVTVKKENDTMSADGQTSDPKSDLKKTFKTTRDNHSDTRKVLITGGDRKGEILKVIRSHKDTTLSDIRSFIADCSEKTIQREIAQMIAAGLVIKNGDKRWATYQVGPQA